jgi:hypothetical protein
LGQQNPKPPDQPLAETPKRPRWGLILAGTSGLAAGWIAAGSVGLLGHPLRRGLVCAALMAAVLVALPRGGKIWPWLALLLAAALAAAMIASPLPPMNVLATAVLLAVLAWGWPEPDRRVLLLAAETVTVLAIYRLALTSIPLVWLAADSCGWLVGRAAGTLTGGPLHVGATFAGLDFLLSMGYLAVRATLAADCPARRKIRWVVAFLLAILVLHCGYLTVLRFSTDLLSVAAPELVEGAESAAVEFGTDASKSFAQHAKDLIPWNLPALAAVFQCLMAGIILTRTSSRNNADQRPSPAGARPLATLRRAHACALLMLAAVVPLATTLCWQRLDLRDKKVVVYKEGFLNWLKPTHGDYGRLGSGMYGMLPIYLESLGAECVISPELSEDDLRDADAVVLIYPNEPWKEGQLDRIWDFVRSGGSLLVLGEHTVREEDGGDRINDVLDPTSMRVRFDSSMFAVGGWLQSYEPLAHPTTAGVTDEENTFGVVIGATVDAGWPARPVLVGRWGWADPGDAAAGESMMGNRRYDLGEKLGDLLLVAEQPFGKGKVIVFGDTSGFTNGLTVGCHEYTSRLYAYLADGKTTCQATWRQWVGLLAAAWLVVLLAWRPSAWHIVAVAVVVSVSLTVSTRASDRAAEVLPDGRAQTPNNLAYIDVSHLHAFSREGWRSEGVMGLCLTLMRNGYLPLMLPEVTEERLSRARLLISVAPAKPYSIRERQAIENFVRDGGIFICTVGYEEAEPLHPLLSKLGYYVGGDPETWETTTGEPVPLGHFKTPFFDGGDYRAYVRFHAAWPIDCDDPNRLVVSHYPPDKLLIVVRRVGRGLVAVIGDTCFAMNKNLELESGVPFEGKRENADFWRWFLALLGEREEEMWYPPKPEEPADAEPATGTPPEDDAPTADDEAATDTRPGDATVPDPDKANAADSAAVDEDTADPQTSPPGEAPPAADTNSVSEPVEEEAP